MDVEQRFVEESEGVAEVRAPLGFARAENVATDAVRPGGVLRAATMPIDADDGLTLEFHPCRIRDCASPHGLAPSLEEHGFDTLDLSESDRLQSLLEGVRRTRRLSADDASSLRRLLRWRSFRLASGKRLRLLFVADEGIILRKGGPNGMKAEPDEKMTLTSGHDVATAVHGDQDVRGTPVRQILRGLGPWLFRHEAPDGFNRRSPLFLVNLWIPLEQITRPLAFMDRRTLDRRRHQARYALPTESFLERDESRRLNDIWSFVHDERQEWHFTSEMDSRRAYVFNTLDTPHGSFVVPGEARAEVLHRRLEAAIDAIGRGDLAALAAAARVERSPLPHDTTLPLRRAIASMEALLAEAQREPPRLGSREADAFVQRARAAMDKVVRKSIELRAVAWLT